MGEVGSLTKSSYLIVMVEETEFFSFFDAKLRSEKTTIFRKKTLFQRKQVNQTSLEPL